MNGLVAITGNWSGTEVLAATLTSSAGLRAAEGCTVGCRGMSRLSPLALAAWAERRYRKRKQH